MLVPHQPRKINLLQDNPTILHLKLVNEEPVVLVEALEIVGYSLAAGKCLE
jgi:hypothetical protein